MIACAHGVCDCPGYPGQSAQSDGHVGGQHDVSENALWKVTWHPPDIDDDTNRPHVEGAIVAFAAEHLRGQVGGGPHHWPPEWFLTNDAGKTKVTQLHLRDKDTRQQNGYSRPDTRDSWGAYVRSPSAEPPPPALWETDRNRNPPILNIAGIGNNLLLLKYPLLLAFLGKASRDKCRKSTHFPEKLETCMRPLMHFRGGGGDSCIPNVGEHQRKCLLVG